MSQDDQDFVVVEEKDLAGFNTAGILPQPKETIDQILKWLQPTDYTAESSEYNKHLASYVPGTGGWIQESDKYQEWLHSENGALWIKATAGAGKSVVAAHTVSLLAKEKAPVLSFFFRQIITTNRSPRHLIRDWMAQLLTFSPELQKRLKEFVDNRRNLDTVAFDELWDVTFSAMESCPRIYCVVDALDEMNSGNEDFMRKLVCVGQEKSSSIKLLMTSRPLPHIEKALANPNVIQLPLRTQLVDRDIAIYIKERLRQTDFPEEACASIKNVLSIKSQGLFLYTRLMLDEILQAGFNDIQTLESALEKLPSGLGHMYAKMLLDHSVRSGTPRDLQIFLLKCVTHSSRPLRLLELSALVGFVRKSSRTQFASDVPPSTRGTKQIVREACGPLLEILEDETVSIIHHSLTEYLTSNREASSIGNELDFPFIDSTTAHLDIAKTCIDYLLSRGLTDWESTKATTKGRQQPTSVARLKHPFLDYATKYWSFHTIKSEAANEDLFQLLDLFLDTKSTLFSSYLEFAHPKSSADKISALHIAAKKGLTLYAKHLLQAKPNIDVEDRKSRTPLHHAAKNGFEEIVEELLVRGAAPIPDDYAGYTPIHLAASRNRAKAVRAFLKFGVDPLTKRTHDYPGNWCGNDRNDKGVTPLQYACEYGHTETVSEFFPYLDGESLSKALLWALQYGKSDTAAMIIENTSVDVNKFIGQQTPIHIAAWSHDLASFRKLVKHGADVKKEFQEYDRCMMWVGDHSPSLRGTPLRTFAQFSSGYPVPLQTSPEDSFEILKILVNAGCDLNDTDLMGQTVFYSILSACRRMKADIAQDIIKYMFANGADSSILTQDGSTALHIMPPHLESAIESLVASGIDVNSRRSSDQRTPLFGAIGNATFISTYTRLGADCNVQDSKGDTPLHVLVQGWDCSNGPSGVAAINALLTAGANPMLKNKAGLTPIHLTCGYGSKGDAISALIAGGADIECRSDEGLTPLLLVTSSGYWSDIQSFLDLGADIHARDFAGRTILHHCCEKTQAIEQLRKLVELGADPKLRDYVGNTLLHVVAKQDPSYYEKEQRALFDALLELGVSPHSVNHGGQTPVHIAARKQTSSYYKFIPLDFFLGPKCGLDINAPDYAGTRALHLTATIGQNQLNKLLRKGADATVLTNEGQTALHVAARSRQSNIVGLLIDQYLKMGKAEMIDQVDKIGRTALHYAVRSGRPESVAILVNTGHANINAKDDKGYTPLSMCAYIREENEHWTLKLLVDQEAGLVGAGIKLNDPYRPRIFQDAKDGIVGSREIIQFLIAHGADVSIMHSKDLREDSRPCGLLEIAAATDSEILVEELLKVEKLPASEPCDEPTESNGDSDDESDDESEGFMRSGWDQFQERFSSGRISNADLLEGLVTPGENNIALFRSLLKKEHEKGIEKFKSLGADMLKPQWDGESCVTILVKGGYAVMLERFGEDVAKMTDSWIEEMEKTDVNLPGRLAQPLLIACKRELPNNEVIKVLVGKFGVDVNAKYRESRFSNDEEGRSSLHILAACTNWWQSHALKYLLENGAYPDIQDAGGNTPLHLAVKSGCDTAVESLLQHGASPNIKNKEDLTCLNLAGSNSTIIGLLVKYGSDISCGAVPFVFNCISSMDLPTIQLLLEMKADFNVRLPPKEPPKDEGYRGYGLAKSSCDMRELAEKSYAIHFAASARFNKKEYKDKMIPIIEILLKGGADPFLSFTQEGDLILHDICVRDGILEPFLDVPGLDLEMRDSKGRTLLLAACATDGDWFVNTHMNKRVWNYSHPSMVQLLLDHGADIAAVDNEGRNLLHHLLTSNDSHKSIQAHHPDDLQRVLAHSLASGLVVQKDKSGTTPLQHALQMGQLSSVEPFLEKGANALEPDPNGNTALHHLAAYFTSTDYTKDYADPSPRTAPLFQKFLELGVDINARNSLGETPIFPFIASEGVCVDHLKMFEERGADLTVLSKRKQGLLHAAARAGASAVFGYLMGKGLDPMLEDNESRSALDFATASGCAAILDMFKREK